jgi:hypothetical protein
MNFNLNGLSAGCITATSFLCATGKKIKTGADHALPIIQKTGNLFIKSIKILNFYELNFYNLVKKGEILVKPLEQGDGLIDLYDFVNFIYEWRKDPFSKKFRKIRNIARLCSVISQTGRYVVLPIGRYGVQHLDSEKMRKLAKTAEAIGTKFPILSLVKQVSASKALSSLAGVGLTLKLIDFALSLKAVRTKASNPSGGNVKNEETNQKKRLAWDLVTTSLGIASIAIPLLVTAHPPVILGLGIVSNTIGLFSIFAKRS